MGLRIRYENSLGTVEMQGNGEKSIRITSIEGLGPAEREYEVSTFSGYDGQETLSSRALPRVVSIGAEISHTNHKSFVKNALKVLNQPGHLVVEDDDFSRRLFCNQVRIPDLERIIRGRLSTIAIQFVCDNPFFEDGNVSKVALYQRTKNLYGTFSLPMCFGETVMGATINNVGNHEIEPIFTILCPWELENAETVTISNDTTGEKIKLSYTPQKDDLITIDVKNRTIVSNKTGNLINNLSDDTFLGDFKVVFGENHISVLVGDIASGFVVECEYSNLYDEAVIV